MKKTLYGREFYSVKFSDESMKKAYMNACKWYATNVLSKDELHNVHVEFIKEKNEQQLPTITLKLFVALDEEEVREKHCKICKESSKLFYLHKESNCIKCEAGALQRRLDEIIRNKISYYNEMMHK